MAPSAHTPFGGRLREQDTRGPLPVRVTLAIAAVVLGAVLATNVVPAMPAGAATSDEARLLALTNQARASVGAQPLSVDPTLSAVARGWAQTMAGQGGVSHNPDIGGQVSGWSRLAENVGYGPDVDWIHRALMASPTHYDNLGDPGFSLAGIAVVSSGGTLYVVENFQEVAGRSAPVVAEPEPEPAPRPVERRAMAVAPEPEPPPAVEPPPPIVVPEPPAASLPSSYGFALLALRALDARHARP